MAGTLAGTTALILCVTLLLSLIDARMAARTSLMAASLQRANDELQQLALQDSLTKLPNRILLEDRIDQAMKQAERTQEHCAVLFIDLDRFKSVNDSLGHFVGDELLRGIAHRLQSVARAEDTVSRLGGDEFVILLRNVVQPDDTLQVAEKVLVALREPFRVHDHELYVTPSIGCSVFPLDGNTAQTLIRRADAAMYTAKESGRNTCRRFEAGMSTFFPERLTLENDLRRAVARGELELHYQPKVDVTGGDIVGMEALLRWRHPDKGLVPPGEFIPVAEECGAIVEIGRWVLEEACRQSMTWQRAGLAPLRVAVNISGVQFRQRGLLETVSLCARDERSQTGISRDRDHGERRHAECLRRDRDAREAERNGRARLDRRFRDRLFQPELSEAVSAGQAEDRSHVHTGHLDRR